MLLLAHSSLLPSFQLRPSMNHSCVDSFVYKMSSRKFLVHSLGVLLVLLQILAPLSGLPIIGERLGDKESNQISEPGTSRPFTAFAAQTMVSTNRPVIDEPESSSYKPNVKPTNNKKSEHMIATAQMKEALHQHAGKCPL